MNVDSFLEHHGLQQNPFEAEEARHDPVFEKLHETSARHPDFGKILGRIDRPSSAVVFGEKGTGKTAIRLMIAKRVAEHNRDQPEKRTLLIAYDDMNPWLDRLLHRRRGNKAGESPSDELIRKTLDDIRLVDHQDAVLSLAVTKVVDALLGQSRGDESMQLPDNVKSRIRQMPRQARADFAVLAALYDQPRGGAVQQRAAKLLNTLRLRRWLPSSFFGILGIVLAVVGIGLFIARAIIDPIPWWLAPAGGVSIAAALALWGVWSLRQVKAWLLTKRVTREMPAVGRRPDVLRRILLELSSDDLASQTWPEPADQDARFQFTSRLLGFLNDLGYVGMLVLVDRVDEPTMVVGKLDRMKPLIWPMFDSKFLQQEHVGIKLLLPIELRRELHRESTDFFQEARLDKQHLIDRLEWSGTTLYDLCNARMRACSKDTEGTTTNLKALFEDNVTREMLIDALDQMHQPRDAFKFVYAVIQEHCRSTAEDDETYHIPRLTLDAVRKSQSQRVQDLSRGLSPA